MTLLFAETGERVVDVEERARKEQEEMALHFAEKEKQVKETRKQTHPQLWRISDQPSSLRLLSDSPSSYLSALPLDIQEEVTILSPDEFRLTDRILWCTPRLCVDPQHASKFQIEDEGLRRKTFWETHTLWMRSGRTVSRRGFKIGIHLKVQLKFKIPDNLSEDDQEALYYHAYRETVLAHEALQSRFSIKMPWGRIGFTSGFSLEDLPSNHIAYIQEARGLSLEEIANIMGGVEGGIPYEEWERIRGKLPQNRDSQMRPLVFHNGKWGTN